MSKFKSILCAILWALLLMIFPLISGIISVIFEMDVIPTLILQWCFMALSLIPLIIYFWVTHKPLSDFGICKVEKNSWKILLFLIPLLLSVLPFFFGGLKSNWLYILVAIAFTIFVGIAEELYFRGFVFNSIKKEFNPLVTILLSSIIFALVHLSSAFVIKDAWMIVLTVLNAFTFGFVAAKVRYIGKSIIPLMIWNTCFDLMNHLCLAQGKLLVVLTVIQVVVMLTYGVYLLYIVLKKVSLKEIDSNQVNNE